MLVAAGLALVMLTSCERRTTQEFREDVLREDLIVMRKQIDAYTEEKKTAPNKLHDLVAAGYLKDVPTDPMTARPDWKFVDGDIHSASNKISTDGTPYNSW